MPCVHRALALKVFPLYIAILMVVVSSLIKQSFPGRGKKINKVSCDLCKYAGQDSSIVVQLFQLI